MSTDIKLLPSLCLMPDRETLAATVHTARWADRALAATPFADEDTSGRDYCYRIADAVLALLVVIYRSDETGSLWARPTGEFEDGRFERLKEKEA